MTKTPAIGQEELAARRELLYKIYKAFNQRDADLILAVMHPDVQWPNGMEGGWVHGREGVRAYWTRQWGLIDPQVEPIALKTDETGRIVVEVHQVVRDLAGAVILDRTVWHAYLFEDGLIRSMEIRE
jgi:nuclear transport factor 2 (NTF2) superfamily protein